MMKKGSLLKMILAAALAVSSTAALTGCGSNNNAERAVSAVISGLDFNKAESISIEESQNSSETTEPEESEEESVEESSEKESSEASVARVLDVEKDIKVTTLSSKQMPYTKEMFSSDYRKNSTMTITTYLVESKYLNDLKSVSSARKDGKKTYDYDADERVYTPSMYAVEKNESYSYCAYYGIIVTGGDAKPSDYYFTCKLDGNEYKVPLTDEIVDMPEELYTNEAEPGNMINLDGEPYFVCGLVDGNVSGGELSGEKHHTSYIRLPYGLRRVNADAVTKLDISKFSYEPDEYIAKEYDTSKITVNITEASKYATYDKQSIQLEFIYEYDEGQYTDEELDELENTMERMANHGYLVYNGKNGKVKIEL